MVLRFYRTLLGLGLLLIGAGIAISSCSPDTSAPTLMPRPTSDGALIPQDGVVTVAEASAAFSVEPFTDFACLDCHTDEARLRELAVDKVKETLSEGPG